jgi:RND family efflux transporter MFP subunit
MMENSFSIFDVLNQYRSEVGFVAKSLLFRLGLIMIVLLLGLAGGAYFIFSEQGTERKKETARRVPVVEVVKVKTASPRVRFKAMGTIKPSREVTLQPRVSGEIIKVSDQFIPGGKFNTGDTILIIDPRDYQIKAKKLENEIDKARSALQIERGEQEVARQELEMSGENPGGFNRSLMLRKPQLTQAEANLQLARLALEEARLDLRRTVLKAPFAAQVLERQAQKGANVSPGQQLVTLAGIEEYWVEVTVPPSNLSWLRIPENSEDTGSSVKIFSATELNQRFLRKGRIKKLIGRLEEKTRQVQLLIAVEDPLGLEAKDRKKLLIGSYVSVQFEGRKIPDVIRLNRSYLRGDNKAWVLSKDGNLSKRDLDIVFSSEEEVFVKSGLKSGEFVITSDLNRPVVGMELKRQESGAPDE